MEVRAIRVSQEGRITVPAKIRRRLRLRRGSMLLLIEEEGRILMEKVESPRSGPGDAFSDLAKRAEASFGELWGNEADEVWNKARGP